MGNDDLQLSQTFEWRGRSVAWDRLGAGEPVVMCHGTPWSAQLWAPFARALSREYSVYLWDMPGYGQSSKHAGQAVDLGTQGELLADLLAQWELGRPHVVAHDYGGAVALRANLLHGAEYASLALVDVVALRPWGSDFFRLVAANADVFAAQPAVVHRGALESYIATASHRGLTRAQLDTLTEPWLSVDGQRAFYQQIAEADVRHTDEVQDRYAELDLPVKVIWGAEDTWIPADRASKLAEAIPGAVLDIIPGAGHLIQYDAPVELAISLHRWLTRF
ncbi:Pimeloyl-ACP methyl ester carboxylesterase [Amycolatopsis xylanica]|uniref:Pimeloyl-ACP methyl ester carboxylesterase n=1 Tax=Amycolatopsis xylanica TaxID=589385 RepID=A0A1H3RW40_9PSEU|nr:alpha/beta fold hydrolase [Amycolatopsis xylanica]SDZ29954.1 Pimeloyl-ACP methyl ester carboxylesterase [Amycolatopsis xylanica]